MTDPLRKMRVGFLALGTIVLTAVVAFHTIAGYTWIDSVWMVVITISTVGYSEQSDASATIKLLSLFTILMGVTAAAYLFTGVIQMVLEGELDRAMGLRRMQKQIDELKNHTIVCGFGKSGPALCERLKKSGHQFVVVDNHEDRIAEAVEWGYLAFQGDATDEDVLKSVRIMNAETIVVSLVTDAENVFITLSARNLCPNLRIVASAERESSSRKLQQAGANEVVMTHQMVADHMSRLVTRPSAAHFFDILSEAGNMELEIDELVVNDDSPLASQTIAESRIRDRYELLIVGLRPVGGEFEFNPSATRTVGRGETMLVMGRAEQIQKFKDTNHLSQTGFDADTDNESVVIAHNPNL